MPEISIDTIKLGTNMRTVPASAEADAGLLASIRENGLLQPVIVKHDGDDEYTLIAGFRRFAAVRELGWSTINAVVMGMGMQKLDGYIAAIGAAENMVRASMHPVDHWRAIVTLQKHGIPFDQATDMLGLDKASAKRLTWLGSMAPEVLAEMGKYDTLPRQDILRTIALAPHTAQVAALETAKRGAGKREIDWWRVSEQLNTKRIPMVLAIFDPKESDIAFDEDLFEQPDAAYRFTTTEVDKFISAQNEALRKEADASKGRIEVIAYNRDAKPPKGWRVVNDSIPKRWKKDDPRKVLACVEEDGYYTGRVVRWLVKPIGARQTIGDVAHETHGGDTAAAPPRMPINKTTLDKLAEIKREKVVSMLHERFDKFKVSDTINRMQTAIDLLLLTLTYENVEGHAGTYGTWHKLRRRIARTMVDDDGDLNVISLGKRLEIVAEVVGALTKFPGQDHVHASGPQAEWLAKMLDIDEMPRCDTEEILKGVSHNELVRLATLFKIDSSGKPKDLRARLAGNMPDWQPMSFGAPGPTGWQWRDDDDDASAPDANAAYAETGEDDR